MKKSKKVFQALALLVVVVIIASFIVSAIITSASTARNPSIRMHAQTLNAQNASAQSVLDAQSISAQSVFGMLGAQNANTSARAMCTMEMGTGRVFYSKNAHDKLAMASTTKIVTAITVIENVPDLDAPVKIHESAIGVEGTSIYLQKGENLTVRELLYGLMLRSGNDAATALAIHTSGSVNAFADKMNELALRVGATNSNFKNPHGLDEEGHYTTAYDLALITAHALKNPKFTEICSSKNFKIPHPEYKVRLLLNKNRLLKSLDGCIGVKTGFTKKAGRCFVGAREKDGMTTVCVVLNCGPMFEETSALLRSASAEFSCENILTSDEIFYDSNGKRAIACEDFAYPLTTSERENLKVNIDNYKVSVSLNDKELYHGECIEILR